MKKYTEEQKIRAIKKLALNYARYNVPDDNLPCRLETRGKRDSALMDAAFKVIIKFGLFQTYQKEIRKEWRRT